MVNPPVLHLKYKMLPAFLIRDMETLPFGISKGFIPQFIQAVHH
jgi:hypothetical protein